MRDPPNIDKPDESYDLTCDNGANKQNEIEEGNGNRSDQDIVGGGGETSEETDGGQGQGGLNGGGGEVIDGEQGQGGHQGVQHSRHQFHQEAPSKAQV